jgi:hypothetical protein
VNGTVDAAKARVNLLDQGGGSARRLRDVCAVRVLGMRMPAKGASLGAIVERFIAARRKNE